MTGSKVTVSRQMKRHLIDRAEWAKKKAYCPYSELPVGAAVLANGHVFHGCNIEVGGRMGTVHAEMLAVFKAVMSGRTRIDAVATVTDKDEPWAACSLCQHVISEFVDDTLIICRTEDGWEEYSLSDEMGDAWRPGDSRDNL